MKKLKGTLGKTVEQLLFYKENYERVQARVCSTLAAGR